MLVYKYASCSIWILFIMGKKEQNILFQFAQWCNWRVSVHVHFLICKLIFNLNKWRKKILNHWLVQFSAVHLNVKRCNTVWSICLCSDGLGVQTLKTLNRVNISRRSYLRQHRVPRKSIQSPSSDLSGLQMTHTQIVPVSIPITNQCALKVFFKSKFIICQQMFRKE